MNKYPYIAESNQSKVPWLIYSESLAICLGCESHSYKKISNYDLVEFFSKNITAEYLRNTKVKIDSGEHSELVQNLVFNAGGSWSSGSVQIKNLGAEWHFIDGELLISNSYQRDCDKTNMRLITIPLPPKDGEEAVEQTEAKAAAAMRTVIDLGYTYHGGELWKPPLGDVKCNHEQFLNRCSENAESARKALWSDYINRSKEWPAVGDEVLYDGSSERLKEIKGEMVKVIGKYSFDAVNYITVKHYDHGVFAMRLGSWIKKPPTPEEELRTKLISVMDNSNTAFAYADFISKAIINGEIEGLEYKPQ